MLTYPFPLKFEKILKDLTLKTMKNCNSDIIYVRSLEIEKDILNEFNKELAEYNLPPAVNFLIFKRKFYNVSKFNTHVDYASGIDEIINASIVVPVEGCQGSYMYWMDGTYRLEKRVLPNGNAYKVVFWEDDPKLISKIEITDCPTLCRVNIPHDATSNSNGSYRTILSIRLEGNPSFEDIIKQRFNLEVL